jgi:hypothetical protein
MLRRLVLAALAALALTVTDAQAAQGARGSTGALSGWLVLDPGSPAGVGLGVRFLLPVIPEGILAGQLRGGVREELDVEFGGDFVHWSYDWRYFDIYGYPTTYEYSVNAVEIVGGVLWNWWLTPKVAVYPKVDLGYSIAWLSDWPGEEYGYGTPSYSELFVNGAAGAMLKLDKFTLRAELGTHTLRLGAAVAF